MTTTGTIQVKIPIWLIGALILLVIIIASLITLLVHQKRTYKEISQLYVTAQDSMKSYRNEKGQFVSTISVLQVTNQKYFTEMQTKDAEIIHLQQLITDETKKRHDVEMALTFTAQTNLHLQDSLTNIICKVDSFVSNGHISYYPTYYQNITDTGKWYVGNVTMGLKLLKLNLSITDKYDVVIGTEPDGLFKRKGFAEITNLNPYSQTKTMKAYQKKSISNKPLKTGLITATIGFIAGVLVHLL
jgi:ABC-type multidrug transport system fused ATPase/permease subunit